MKRKSVKYTSPFEKLNSDQRYEVASKIAADFGLEPSQVLFAYLQTVAQVSAGSSNESRLKLIQPEVDVQFGKTLTALQAAEKRAD